MMELKSILVCHTLLRYDTLLSLPAVVYVCGLFQRRHSGKTKHRAYAEDGDNANLPIGKLCSFS